MIYDDFHKHEKFMIKTDYIVTGMQLVMYPLLIVAAVKFIVS